VLDVLGFRCFGGGEEIDVVQLLCLFGAWGKEEEEVALGWGVVFGSRDLKHSF
jgi:hypothetical protein